MNSNRQNVLTVSSFLVATRPECSIFNLRTAKQLQNFVDIDVQLSTWLTGRRPLRHYEIEGIKVCA